jgi:hypothetical protein
LADAADMIGRRSLIDHHTYTPKVRVSSQQPRGPNEERGLTETKRYKHGPQSPWEVASVLTIIVGLCEHSIAMRRCTDMLSCRQLHPHHLDKGR